MNTLIEPRCPKCGLNGDLEGHTCTPTMPDDVAEMVDLAHSLCSPKMADLLEHQEQQIQWWITQTKANQADYLKAQRKIEKLEAALASTHFHHKKFEPLCPECQAALAERNQDDSNTA